ncbi:MAG: amino acid ABC transporter substrate-binding protein [Chitinophagaceae bacterium]|nr:MAG: amino acid ABC transporter substrate-binding protein [Chitinophagaceae bacterium]
MNGNKKYIWILLLSIVFQSCAILRGPSEPERDVLIIDGTRTEEELKAEDIEIIVDPDVDPDEVYIPKIGFLLPLFLDSLNINIYDEIYFSPEDFERSKLGLNFLKGVKLAIDSLDKKGLNLNVKIWDSANDPQKVRRLFNSGAFDSLDILIGPIYNSPLRTATQLNKNKELFVVSPLSPADNITEKNPYYLQINPTIKMHCDVLFDYIIFKHRYQNNIVLYPEQDKNSPAVEYLKELLKIYTERNPFATFKLQFAQIDSARVPNANLSRFLVPGTQNNFIIPTLNPGVVNNFARQLFNEVEDYDINVFGFPIWGNVERIRMDYLHGLNVHFTSSFHTDNEKKEIVEFNKKFYQAFNNIPDENSIKAYDISMYFFYLLHEFGQDFKTYLEDYIYRGLHTNLYFKAELNDDILTTELSESAPQRGRIDNKNDINFYQNSSLHILRFEDFSLKKVN